MSDTGAQPSREARGGHRTAYWGALDGMRAFGVIAVMLYHLGRDHGGFLAVDMFFVISGFLITSLLLGERAKNGRVSLRNFYTRRALRLLPALVVALLGAVALTVIVADQHAARRGTLHGLPFVLFYVGNWKVAFEGDGALGVLTHTWSLAVEEQFYILWPALFLLLIKFVPTRKKVGVLLVAASAAVAFYRWEAYGHGWGIARVYYATDTHCDGLLLGCGLAFLLAARTPGEAVDRGSWTRRSLRVAAVVAAAFMGFEWYHATIVSRWSLGVTMPVFNVATCLVIYDQVLDPSPVLTELLNCPPARWLGKRSYALYLWHPLVNKFVEDTPLFHHGETIFVASCLSIAIAVAALSWHFVEAPFLQLKKRFEKVEAMPESLLRQLSSSGATEPS